MRTRWFASLALVLVVVWLDCAVSAQDRGAISGTGGLIKNGGGLLSLNANNTFTGGIQLNGGTLSGNARDLCATVDDDVDCRLSGIASHVPGLRSVTGRILYTLATPAAFADYE